MEAVEIAPLHPQSRPIPKEAVRRAAFLATLFAFCVSFVAGVVLLAPVVIATANAGLDRFTGADRIARPDLADREIRTWPKRPIPPEWEWRSRAFDVDGMFRDPH
jgi:sterol desaturase/sphingolipid hydroxylase (fatty acid hydroxylase superfamily)